MPFEAPVTIATFPASLLLSILLSFSFLVYYQSKPSHTWAKPPSELSPRRPISSERHHCTRNLRNQLVIVSKNVADVSTNLSPYIHRFGNCANPTIPDRTKEVDLQIDAGEAFVLVQGGRVGRSDRGISDVAQHATVDRAHRIGMLVGVRNNLYRRNPWTNFDQLKAEGFGDCGRIDETRFGCGSIAVSSNKFEKLKIRQFAHRCSLPPKLSEYERPHECHAARFSVRSSCACFSISRPID